MSLTPGTRLGPYQIVEPIGAGGMGEVYKASDTRLDRVVAIKVLPQHWAADVEMRQRFEREAQALASLNHPHICVLYDIGLDGGTDFLVMEYLEGETLGARLERGPVGLADALKFGIQIADALDKAHRRGVVHRDLKPSNVMLTPSGTKLLDFGLAKFARGLAASSASFAESPTTMLPAGKDLTTPGAVIGTLQYMAPEQIEGLEADARTDIFALGTLLHEMISGKKAFEGKSRLKLITAIASFEPPPVSALDAAAPPALDHVVRTCLAKEPADRWQTARDLLMELEWIAEGGADQGPATPVAHSTSRRLWIGRAALAVAGVLAGVVVTLAARFLGGAASPEEFRVRVPIQLTAQTQVAGGQSTNPAAAQGYQGVSGPAVFDPANFAVSPDGRTLAFVARQSNAPGAAGPDTTWFLYVRPINSVTPQRLPGTEGAVQPFWSADGRAIGFVAGGKLKRVEATGGPPQELCDAGGFTGGTWNRDGVVLFGSAQGLRRVSAQGGKPEQVTRLAESDAGHYWPHFLPDGRHFLYTAWSGQASGRAVLAGSIDSPTQRTKVLAAGSNAGYAGPGFLVFHRDEAVYAQHFDARTLALTGDPVRIANDITYDNATGRGNFSVAAAGALAYFFSSVTVSAATGANSDLSEWQYSWIDRNARILEAVGPPGVYRGIEPSPDTKRVAVHRHDAKGGDVIVFEPRGSEINLTLNAAQHNSMPVWSPDGGQIVFASLRNGKWGLYQTPSTRAGTQGLLYESDLPIAPMSWSPDGKRIAFWTQDPTTAGDIWVLTVDDKKASKLIATAFNEIHPQISPDGKWIAYADNSKDSRFEIYVQPFPSGTDKYQISTDGGDWPRWRGDTRELFWHSLGLAASPGTSAGAVAFASGLLLSAPIDVKGGVMEPGAPRQILSIPAVNLPHSGGSYHMYAVDPKGERFLALQYAPSATAQATSQQIGPDTFSGLTVALNWTSAIRK